MFGNGNNKTRMEKTEQLKSILTDLDNRELTKHQAHDLICVLFSVVVPKGTLCCPECKSTDLKVAIHTDYNECNKCYHYWEI